MHAEKCGEATRASGTIALDCNGMIAMMIRDASTIWCESISMKRRRKSLAGSWLDLATSSLELMQGSAVVIAARTTAMAAAGTNPSAKHDREMKRMVDEKVSASAESMARMAVTAGAACQSMFVRSMLGGRAPTASQVQRLTTNVLEAGMAPYKRTVRSNVKRLRK